MARPDFVLEGRAGAFWSPERFNTGGMWVGYFTGESPWEIHRESDELLHALKGEVQLTVLTDEGRETTMLRAGEMIVVPQGCWHKFNAPDGVTVLTATPQPTDHSTAEDPRTEA